MTIRWSAFKLVYNFSQDGEPIIIVICRNCLKYNGLTVYTRATRPVREKVEIYYFNRLTGEYQNMNSTFIK